LNFFDSFDIETPVKQIYQLTATDTCIIVILVLRR
jgi:hypothetical protein